MRNEFITGFQSASPKDRLALLRDLFTECELTVHEVSAIKGWIRLRRDVVSRLSVELATEILSYLDYRQLVACRLVYYGLCVDGSPTLWKRHCIQHYISVTASYEGAFRQYSVQERAWRCATPLSTHRFPVGHEERVNCVKIVPDTPWLITGSLDRTLIIWNRYHRSVERVWTCDAIYALDATAQWVIVSHYKGFQCTVWKSDGTLVGKLRGHAAAVHKVQIWGDCVLTVGNDGVLIVWNVSTARTIAQWTQYVESACWVNATQIVGYERDGRIRLLEFREERLVTVQVMQGEKSMLAMQSVGNQSVNLLFSKWSMVLRVDKSTLRIDAEYPRLSQDTFSCFALARERLVYCRSFDALLCVENFTTKSIASCAPWKKLGSWPNLYPSCLAMDSDCVYVGCMDGTLVVVDFSNP